jgi:sentrin-specific protease 1
MWLEKYVTLVKSSFEFSKWVKDLGRAKKEVQVYDAILGEIPPEALKPPPRPRYMYLSPQERESAEKFFSDKHSDPNEILVKRNNVELTRDKLMCLCDKTWLNDEVINWYMDMLNDRVPRKNGPKTFCWNSFFWLKLSDDGKGYNYNSVRRWSTKRKIKIFDFDRILVPMNIGRNHWAIGLVDIRNKKVRYYDSLAAGTVHTAFAEFILKYLEDEFKDKNKDAQEQCPEFSKDFIAEPVYPPQQLNGYDCGVFTCMNAECLSNGRDSIDFTQKDIPEMRRKMLCQVLENNIDGTSVKSSR